MKNQIKDKDKNFGIEIILCETLYLQTLLSQQLANLNKSKSIGVIQMIYFHYRLITILSHDLRVSAMPYLIGKSCINYILSKFLFFIFLYFCVFSCVPCIVGFENSWYRYDVSWYISTFFMQNVWHWSLLVHTFCVLDCKKFKVIHLNVYSSN